MRKQLVTHQLFLSAPHSSLALLDLLSELLLVSRL